ncbi:hypothetical protein BHECKSOX_2061 [Bathymodiolus heckerae thiotrophic gill symbiont]|uniref:LolA-related protein n=1 Tax=Bathymodiolus heckerae thiotrophic gill symbiont TaxID=1052212 RepID=UPI0010B26FEC|nr:LolA-related protein [Bathymodiolus heckerae thiotrophic gill symbiont]SHN91677.1 hypothetical protein BHECKSOX_2061 [Bathymodiolus heckerae thiotrophic gill symbiont]
MCRSRIFAILIIFFSSNSYSALDIDNVFKLISENSVKTLGFIETHSETLFTKEVKVTGRVAFSENGSMSKYIETPSKSEVHIIGDTLSLIDNKGVKSVSLDNYPALSSGINAVRWILLGEKNKILNNYSINYSLKDDYWTINLKPIKKQELLQVLSISIKGKFGNIGLITLLKANGSSIRTTFISLKK